MRFHQYTGRILVLLCLLSATTLNAQITLTPGNGYIDQPMGVISIKVKQAGVDAPYKINTLPADKVLTTHGYVDGFGRPLQNIIEAGSPNGKDIIQIFRYDDLGAEATKYLPFEASTTNGVYQSKTNSSSNQLAFYNGTAMVADDDYPYSSSAYEASPLMRLLKQGNFGDGFQLNQHYKELVHRTNETGDNVRKWDATGASSAVYSAGELSVTEAIDEAGSRLMVFADRLGRTILQKQQSGTGTYTETYNIFDRAGNLVFVVSPKAVTKLSSIGGTWNVASVPELIYSYKYDNRNRLTEKKMPNAGVVYMVYDPFDRVVLAQNANMRSSNQWFYSKFNSRNSVIAEGVYTHGSALTQAQMQAHVDAQACYTNGNHFEQHTAQHSFGYTNNCFPTSGLDGRIYYYFDDYDFNNDGVADESYTAQSLPGEATAIDKTRGLVTGVKKRRLGTSDWLTTYTFYDKNFKIIQSKSNNQLNANRDDITTNVIDFGGRLVESKETKNTGTANVTVRNSLTYDKMDRVTEMKQGIDGAPMIIVAKHEYNAIGQLVDKKLHSTNGGGSFLQSVDLRYNIRGQMSSINNATLSNDAGVTNNETNDIFGMELLYNNFDAGLGNTADYTGMISAVKWKSLSPVATDQRAYLFNYDRLYRMTAAIYKANSGSGWSKDVNGYDESAAYDENGNITSLLRNTVISGSVTQIDNLAYSYSAANDNNQLLNVTESSSTTLGFRNPTGSSSGYTYDANGNLTADPKKGITIEYNEMNKVTKITQTSTGKRVEYRYDASGARISKWTHDGTQYTVKMEYIGVFVFEDKPTDELKYFSMAEGRVRKSGGNYFHEYFIADHQGNVRVSFEDNGSGTAVLRQENSYYPYGLLMNNQYLPTDQNNNLYNAGSEWQNELNGLLDQYTTFYREYDASLARFNSVDPKAEMSVSWSVYHYSANNPINFNDPMGDLTQGALMAIISELWNSDYGGAWDAHGNTLAYFGDEETASFFGAMSYFGIHYSINENGVTFFGGGRQFDDNTISRIVAKYTTILYNSDRTFSSITIGQGESQVRSDLDLIAKSYSGAFLLAIIDVLGYPVEINAIAGARSHTEPNGLDKGYLTSSTITYDPTTMNFDKVTFPSFVTLAHELFHVLDQQAFYNGNKNYYWPFEAFSTEYRTHLFRNENDNFPFTYVEARAVLFENSIRAFYHLPRRSSYSGVDLTAMLRTLTQLLKDYKYF